MNLSILYVIEDAMNFYLFSDDYCGTPLIPAGGKITEVSKHKFQYSCSSGLRLIGNATATCEPSTGRWTGAPTCVVGNVAWTSWQFCLSLKSFLLISESMGLWIYSMVGVDLDCCFGDRSIGGQLVHLEVHPPAKYSG